MTCVHIIIYTCPHTQNYKITNMNTYEFKIPVHIFMCADLNSFLFLVLLLWTSLLVT